MSLVFLGLPRPDGALLLPEYRSECHGRAGLGQCVGGPPLMSRLSRDERKEGCSGGCESGTLVWKYRPFELSGGYQHMPGVRVALAP